MLTREEKRFEFPW